MRPPVSVWKATLLYVLHDLRDLVRNPSIWMTIFGFPMILVMFFGVMGVQAVVLGDRMVETVTAEATTVVVAPEDVDLVALQAHLGDQGEYVASHAPPDDLDEGLENGRYAAVATMAPGARTIDDVMIRLGADGMSWRDDQIEWALGSWFVHALHVSRGGPVPELVPVGFELPEDAEEAATAFDASEVMDEFIEDESWEDFISWFAGAFGIGMFSTLIALMVGPAVLKSMREGFNGLLALGTPPRAIFMTEAIVAVVFSTMQALGWWLVIGIGLATTGLFSDVTIYIPEDWPMRAVLFVVLCPLAFVPATGAGLFGAMLFDDLPHTVRENVPRAMLILAFLIMAVLPDFEVLGGVMAVLAWVPVAGPVCLWFAYIDGATWVLWALPLHVLYLVVAMAWGGWAVSLDEGLISYVKRRRRST